MLSVLAALACLAGLARAGRLPKATANPVGIEPEVFCGVNELAYNWSLRALPARAPLVEAWDALRLTAECNMTRPSVSGPWAPKGGPLPAGVPAFYVDPDKGSDSAAGTKAAPFKTIFRAVGAVRAAKAVLEDDAAPYAIVLRGGTHALPRPIKLTAIDSGLKLLAYPGESPLLSTGVELSNLSWKPTPQQGMGPMLQGINGVNDLIAANASHGTTVLVPGVTVLGHTDNPTSCQSLCEASSSCTSWTWHDAQQVGFANLCAAHTDGVWQPSTEQGHVSGQKLHVYVADVSSYDLKDFSQLWFGKDGGFRRATRARFPSGNPETMGLWTDPETIWLPSAQSWMPPADKGDAMTVSIATPVNNGTHFPGWPLGVGGPGNGAFYPPRSYWLTADPVGGGGATYGVPSGFVPDSSTWTDKQWKHNPTGAGVVVGSYQNQHWGSWVFSAASANSSAVIFDKGGFQECRGSKTGSEIYIENVLEELDSPNEWFFDAEAQLLYFYPNTTTGPPSGDPMVAAQGKYAVFIEGTQSHPARDVTISGITFAHTDATILDEYEVPSSGDYAIHRRGVVTASGVERLNISNCLFRSPGGNGIVLTRYARDVTISGNEIVWAGENGIVVWGDCNLIDCTVGDQPQRVLIDQNLIHEIGIYNQQTASVFVAKSANVTISRLVAFNMPRQGTVWNDGAFGGHVLADSAVFMTTRSTGDCGPMYSWMRTLYVHDDDPAAEGVQPTIQQKLSTVRNNVLLTNWHSVWPEDTDDGSAHILATHNAFAWGGSKNYLGHSKTWTGNVYIYPDAQRAPAPPVEAGRAANLSSFFTQPYCLNTAGQDSSSGWGESWTNNTCFLHGSMHQDAVYSLGSCSTSNPTATVPFTQANVLHTDDGNAVFDCGSSHMTLAQWQALGQDTGTTVKGQASIGDIVAAARAALLST